jgi:hypothetical protein
MISIGSVTPNRGEIAPIKGTIPTGATWDQYIPIVDEDGLRLSLTNYSFELTFTDRDENVILRLGTASGEILKTTDSYGDTLRVFASADDMSDVSDGGAYTCNFAAKDTDDQVWLLAQGTVVFLPAPPAFA